MGLGSDNAIILMKNYEVLLSFDGRKIRRRKKAKKRKRSCPRLRSDAEQPRSLVQEVSFEDINPTKKTEGTSVNTSLIQGILNCKENAKYPPCDCTSPHLSDWKNWMKIFSKKTYIQFSEQLELYAEVSDDFMKSMWDIDRHDPVLYLQGRFEVGLTKRAHSRCSPVYSTGQHVVNSHQHLTGAIGYRSFQNRNEANLLVLKDSIPIHDMDPLSTGTVKLHLDVAIEWWHGLPLEIGVGSGNEIMKSFFEDESTKDVTIVVGNGAEVKCHSLILKGQSSTLTAMLSPSNGMKEAQTLTIEMKDMSEEAMILLVRCFYGMAISLPDLACDVALQLLQFADKYKLSKLEGDFTRLLLAKSEHWFTPDVILELYYYAKNLETLSNLREHALEVMAKILEKVRFCESFQELDPVEAENLVWNLTKSGKLKSTDKKKKKIVP